MATRKNGELTEQDKHPQEHDDAIMIARELLDPSPITIEALREMGWKTNGRFWWANKTRVEVLESRWYWTNDSGHINPPPTTLGQLRQLMMRAG